MRDVKMIESMELLELALPIPPSVLFYRYETNLKSVLKENIRGLQEVRFAHADGRDPAHFAVDVHFSHWVADDYPNLQLTKHFQIDPLKPLLPQMESMQTEIESIDNDLVAAAKAIRMRRDA